MGGGGRGSEAERPPLTFPPARPGERPERGRGAVKDYELRAAHRPLLEKCYEALLVRGPAGPVVRDGPDAQNALR